MLTFDILQGREKHGEAISNVNGLFKLHLSISVYL